MSNMYEQGPGTEQREQFRQDYADQQNHKRSRTVWVVGGIGVILLLLLILGGSACGSYNTLVTKQQAVKAAYANVDVQLQRRSDLIPNLVNTVKGYTKHEETVFGEVAQANAGMLRAGTVGEKAQADAAVTGALGRLLALAQAYPELKADKQFMRLQDELAGTENRLAVARRDYNQVVLDYNTTRQRFPTVIAASTFGFKPEEQFKSDAAARQNPTVDFNKP
jgi:LemA protein